MPAADLIICTGLFDDEAEQPQDYHDMLRLAVTRGLPMVCANPDVVVMRGEKIIPCAGAVAAYYERLGGRVERFGKPHGSVFEMVLQRLPGVARRRVVMVGDGLHTDIAGAHRAGLDSIFVAGGIHAEDVGFHAAGAPDLAAVRAAARRARAMPTAMIGQLVW